MQSLDWSKAQAAGAAPFRFRPIGDRVLISNDLGDWLLLTADEFEAFLGATEPSDPLAERLRSHRFLAADIDVEDATLRYRDRRWFVAQGPHLHVFVLDGEATEEDESAVMDVDTVERGLDCAFMSTSDALTLAFRGTAPLAHWDVLTRAVAYAEEKNRLALKNVGYEIDTDLAALNDDKLAWLLEHEVTIRATVDQTALDDTESPVRVWVPKVHAGYAERGHDAATHHVQLVSELDPALLDRSAELVDLAVELGCQTLELRPTADLGFLLGAGGQRPYSIEAWLAAYERALDRAIEHERDGRPVTERTARVFLTKVLGRRDPNDRDIRSPASDGIGQLAYSWDGRVYASDAGRRIGDLGDPLFELGELRYNGYHDMVTHPTVRALVLATALEGQPDCAACVYQPFCGQCPAHNYAEQGSIHGRMRDSSVCHRVKTIQDMLFARLAADDDATRQVFERWAGATS